MKILLALAAFALAAVLIVSATMGAETLVPGGESKKKTTPVGGLVPSGGKARLFPSGFASLKGTGFKPRENVTVKVLGDITTSTRRRVQADASGSFIVRLPKRGNRCNGMTATAVGDKGSRASFQLAELLCAAPGSSP